MKRTAYCKINLTLEILGTRRNDGFHDLKSIMHKIPLGDEIELVAGHGSGKITLFCDSDVCDVCDNLAYKAAKMYIERYKQNTGKNADVEIKLTKITPTGAGLGGGSADAACVLDMLEIELGGVSDKETLEMAEKLGSDVPFCLERYTSAVCTGRGEMCQNTARLPDGVCIVVAKPAQSINTKGIYAEYDKAFGDDYSKSKTEEMQKALENGNLSEIAKYIMNDFEYVCIPRLPEIETIKKEMIKLGAVSSSMSGSGSAVFGLFDDENKCKECGKALKEQGCKDVFCFFDEDFKKMYNAE